MGKSQDQMLKLNRSIQNSNVSKSKLTNREETDKSVAATDLRRRSSRKSLRVEAKNARL